MGCNNGHVLRRVRHRTPVPCGRNRSSCAAAPLSSGYSRGTQSTRWGGTYGVLGVLAGAVLPTGFTRGTHGEITRAVGGDHRVLPRRREPVRRGRRRTTLSPPAAPHRWAKRRIHSALVCSDEASAVPVASIIRTCRCDAMRMRSAAPLSHLAACGSQFPPEHTPSPQCFGDPSVPSLLR